MPLAEIVLIALGLSMDAFAVSVVSGLSLERNCFPHALQKGFVFGIFQAGMFILGWWGGIGFRHILAPLDHWIAFGLLLFIGLHMILSALKPGDCRKINDGFGRLIMLGVATSIDALAVGLAFALLGVRILLPILIIGLVTFMMSFGGVYLGQRVGRLFARRIEALGGVILILIGVRILVKHLATGT